jgi:hypothetical protein
MHPFFRNAPFDQERIDLMSAVFERIIKELALSDDDRCDLVADAILECAQQGTLNPSGMRKCAYEVLDSAL